MSDDLSTSEKLAVAVAENLSLASSQFAWSFDAKFHPMPRVDLNEIGTSPTVYVRDIGQRSLGLGARGWTDNEYEIQVIGRVRFANEKSQTLSKLKKLGEQLSDHFWQEFPSDSADETLDRIEAFTVAPDKEVDEQLVGRLSMTLVFFGSRARPS